MKFYFPEEENYREIQVEMEEEEIDVKIGRQSFKVEVSAIDARRLLVIVNHQPHLVEVLQSDSPVVYRVNGREYQLEILTEQERLSREMFGDSESEHAASEIRAPMPGLVLKILVKPGDRVTEGQPLLIMEAMKMENEIRSTVAGMIKQVKVNPQQPVEKDEVLIVLE